MTEITDDDLVNAIDRLARTSDGALFYRYLQKIIMGVPVGDLSDSALRRHDGRRSLAHDLMGLMAKGIDDSDRTADRTDRTSGRPVVFAPSKPASGSRRESFRDHAIRTDPELAAIRARSEGAT